MMTNKEHTRRRPTLFAGGAVLTAIVASACCWLPLLFLGFGISAAGVSATFEQVRPLFLGVTVVLLGTGFFFTYFRKPPCKPSSFCEAPNTKLRWFNQVMLWLATAAVFAFALFPQYAGLLASTSTTGTVPIGTEARMLTLDIEGMTCEACAMHLERALADVPGVGKANVSYADGTAVLTFSSDQEPTRTELAAAITKVGYTLK